MRTKLTLSVAACVVLAGCAAPMVRMTYHSVPEGATLVEGSETLGVTPVTIPYSTVPAWNKGECMQAEYPVVAHWASGATQTYDGTMCPSVGYVQQVTFRRPPNAPGAALDAQVGATRAYQLAAREAAAAQQQAVTEAVNEAALDQAAGALGGLAGCALAGGCLPVAPHVPPVPVYPPPARYPPPIRLPPPPQFTSHSYVPPPPTEVVCSAVGNTVYCH